jgi:hypothetical protein
MNLHSAGATWYRSIAAGAGAAAVVGVTVQSEGIGKSAIDRVPAAAIVQKHKGGAEC